MCIHIDYCDGICTMMRIHIDYDGICTMMRIHIHHHRSALTLISISTLEWTSRI